MHQKKPYSGGKFAWPSTLKGYALKLNLVIDGIRKQPHDEMEITKDALNQQFDNLNYLLAYKIFKDQIVVLLKSRCGWLKKKIEKGEDHPHNCLELHWNQLKEVLAQEKIVERVDWMNKIRAMQKNVSHVGWSGEIGVEEWMVSKNW